MTENVSLRPVSTLPTADAVVTIEPTSIGAHTGLFYRADDAGTYRHLHLADHFRLKNDPGLPRRAHWVAPRLDELTLEGVRYSANLIARRHEDGRIPYALEKADAEFAPGGSLELHRSRGLTCSTFVSLVFEHARVKLLDEATWEQGRSPERVREDQEAQERLVSHLRTVRGAEDHAKLVAAEVGCTRFRPEEVAAASGMSGHPITFARAEPQGRHVLASIRAPGARS